MPKREIEAPSADWLTEEEAVQYLRLNSLVFRQLVDAGVIVGVRKLSRQCVLYHWKGLIVAQWRLELGDLPELEESGEKSPEVAKSGQKRGKVDESGS